MSTGQDPHELFRTERAETVARNGSSPRFRQISAEWMRESAVHKYSYLFSALGRPIIQLPQDMVALQELIWEVKPDLIIETGIAHGGSLILSASMLALLDLCDAIEQKETLDPAASKRKVLGIDIDIRSHNRSAIDSHPMSFWIQMLEGSSMERSLIEETYDIAKTHKRTLVILDSNHSHGHVLGELKAYAPLVSLGSYCVVFDTVVEDLPQDLYPDKPWGPGNNPKTAVREFLETNKDFEIDEFIENRLMLTVAPGGYLKRIS